MSIVEYKIDKMRFLSNLRTFLIERNNLVNSFMFELF